MGKRGNSGLVESFLAILAMEMLTGSEARALSCN